MKAFIDGFKEGLQSKPDDNHGDFVRIFTQLLGRLGLIQRSAPVLA